MCLSLKYCMSTLCVCVCVCVGGGRHKWLQIVNLVLVCQLLSQLLADRSQTVAQNQGTSSLLLSSKPDSTIYH